MQPIKKKSDYIKKENVFEIENERKVHYAWYGTWAAKLVANDFPKWVKMGAPLFLCAGSTLWYN